MKSFLLSLCLLVTAGAQAQNDFCGGHNTSFKDGEQMSFKVFYNMGRIWVNAGDATFTAAQQQMGGRTVYHITGIGKTQKSYEWFYKVSDRYETFIDAATMLPVKFVRDVSEGKTKINNIVTFNQAQQKAISNGVNFSLPKCTQDVLSSIYYARNIDYSKYKPGARIPFTMFLDDKVYNLYLRYLGKEKIETRYGTFNAIKISPLLIQGTIFKGGDQMMVWVSDDANHLPVRIESPIVVGSIKVDLMGFTNLRNPLGGLISKK